MSALTAAEALAFERDGYVHFPAALAPAALAALRAAAAALAPDDGVFVNRHDLFTSDERFLPLIDLEPGLRCAWSLLGWNIHCFHTQLIVTPPQPVERHAGTWGWHQDNNRMNRDLEVALQPRMSVKVAYFLTDCNQTGMGNFAVVPGSHLLRQLTWLPGAEQPHGYRELCVAAGDAVVFDRRLWHAGATNRSTTTRRAIFVGYSPRWLRPKCDMEHAALIAATTDPVRRQLLGWATSANGRYDVTPADVPLRDWIQAQHGDQAVRP